MRLHRGKVLHKERWRDQERKPAEHHSRGRLEEETGMVEGGKCTERSTKIGKYISSFSQNTYLNHSLMDGKNCVHKHFAALLR